MEPTQAALQAVRALRIETFGDDAEIRPTAARISDLIDVRRYIDEMDFRLLHQKLGSDPPEGFGWPPDRVDHADRLYRNWLYLARKHEGEPLVPTRDIDELWHAHILDTYAYARDCDCIFGYFRHHFPYLGIRNKADHATLVTAAENTQNRYFDEYGTYIYDWS